MNDFLLVLGIAFIAAFLTYLGVPIAERFELPHRVVSAALQFAAGVLTAIVGFSLMPIAVTQGPTIAVIVAFFIGGAVFVAFEYYSAKRAAEKSPGSSAGSLGLYFGVLMDLLIDGIVIGIGSTLTFATGVLLAVGIAISTAPLAFVTIAAAKRQGMAVERRRRLGYLFFLCLVAGAVAGYLLLRDQPQSVKLTLIALASGFLITTVTQSMIPEANRKGETTFAGIFFVAGLSLYALFTLAL